MEDGSEILISSSPKSATSSFEALDTHDPNLSKLATKMFQKTADYIEHELNTPLEDYKLLENMNRVTISKYSDMNQIADNLSITSAELKQKLDELMPYLEQIDEIDKTANQLEIAAYKLDSYTQKLENKFNSLIKKK